MSSYLLKRCSEALYGTRWLSELARDLNVTDRTVRRWVEGSSNVPERVYRGLVRLCEGRRAELDELIKVLAAQATATSTSYSSHVQRASCTQARYRRAASWRSCTLALKRSDRSCDRLLSRA